jgi:hypothetical protein
VGAAACRRDAFARRAACREKDARPAGMTDRIRHALGIETPDLRGPRLRRHIGRARAVPEPSGAAGPHARTRSPCLTVDHRGQVERPHGSRRSEPLHDDACRPASRAHGRRVSLGRGTAAPGRRRRRSLLSGYEQGRYTAHAIARACAKPGADRFGTTREDLSRDWAVVELAGSIARKPLGLSRAIGPGTGATVLTGIVHAGYDPTRTRSSASCAAAGPVTGRLPCRCSTKTAGSRPVRPARR